MMKLFELFYLSANILFLSQMMLTELIQPNTVQKKVKYLFLKGIAALDMFFG